MVSQKFGSFVVMMISYSIDVLDNKIKEAKMVTTWILVI